MFVRNAKAGSFWKTEHPAIGVCLSHKRHQSKLIRPKYPNNEVLFVYSILNYPENENKTTNIRSFIVWTQKYVCPNMALHT